MLQLEFLFIFTELVHMCRKLNKSHSFASCKIQYVTGWMFTHLIGYFVLENYLCKNKESKHWSLSECSPALHSYQMSLLLSSITVEAVEGTTILCLSIKTR